MQRTILFGTKTVKIRLKFSATSSSSSKKHRKATIADHILTQIEKSNKSTDNIIKAKRIECVIGLFLLLPPILGVIAFVLQIFEADTDFSMMRELSSAWTAKYDQGGGMSAAPIYLGLMALAGVYLIKNSFYSLFTALDNASDTK